jgi:hypothetical protein
MTCLLTLGRPNGQPQMGERSPSAFPRRQEDKGVPKTPHAGRYCGGRPTFHRLNWDFPSYCPPGTQLNVRYQAPELLERA